MTVARPIEDAAVVVLMGGVLFGTKDPLGAARALADYICEGKGIPSEHAIDGELVETARRMMRDVPHGDVGRWCDAGAGWVLGYRAAPARPGWEMVISQPHSLGLPIGIARTTAETMVGIVGRAHRRVVIASPFIDGEAIRILAPSLVDAAGRGVDVAVLTVGDRAYVTSLQLKGLFAAAGCAASLSIRRATESQAWPHLKVLLADGREGYVGSANLTGNALMGRNLELGVLLRGDLSGIEALFAVAPADVDAAQGRAR